LRYQAADSGEGGTTALGMPTHRRCELRNARPSSTSPGTGGDRWMRGRRGRGACALAAPAPCDSAAESPALSPCASAAESVAPASESGAAVCLLGANCPTGRSSADDDSAGGLLGRRVSAEDTRDPPGAASPPRGGDGEPEARRRSPAGSALVAPLAPADAATGRGASLGEPLGEWDADGAGVTIRLRLDCARHMAGGMGGGGGI
jgi:hypothetical protein